MFQLRPVSRVAVAETYEEFLSHIVRSATKFARKYRLDTDDAIQVASVAFLEAYHKYDPARGSFKKRLSVVVYGRLMDHVRQRARDGNNRTVGIQHALQVEADIPGRFEEIRSFISDDARAVLELVASAPDDLMGLVNSGTSWDRQKGVRRYLLENLGWGIDRVTESIREVKEALS